MATEQDIQHRAYFFGNMYLSSIQQGIQAQHCTAELFVKYPTIETRSTPADRLHLWAKDDKVTIVLNGGYSDMLAELLQFFESPDNPYPFASFHESEEALNGALTCVGVVLPNKVYDSPIFRLALGRPSSLTRVDPSLVCKEDYEMMLKLGYWRADSPVAVAYGKAAELLPIEVSTLQTNNITWWDYVMSLKLKQYQLAR